MTDDEKALRAAIAAAPLDRAPPLVFADWLDEQGRHDAARHYRRLGSTLGEPKKPTIPEYIDRFIAYLNANGEWGSLHIILADGNVGDDSVLWCIKYAAEHGDEEGRQLGGILLKMSPTQRSKLPRVAWRRSHWTRTSGWFGTVAGPLEPLPSGAHLALGPNGLIGWASPAPGAEDE